MHQFPNVSGSKMSLDNQKRVKFLWYNLFGINWIWFHNIIYVRIVNEINSNKDVVNNLHFSTVLFNRWRFTVTQIKNSSSAADLDFLVHQAIFRRFLDEFLICTNFKIGRFGGSSENWITLIVLIYVKYRFDQIINPLSSQFQPKI